jgi:hypothetical protein
MKGCSIEFGRASMPTPLPRVRATPFKRPVNAQFLTGSNFQTFFFDPTGDTNANAGTLDLAAGGSWGSIFRVDLNSDREAGSVSGDAIHASFDNLTFADANTLLVAEDRGDTLHSELNRLDSIWACRKYRPEW